MNNVQIISNRFILKCCNKAYKKLNHFLLVHAWLNMLQHMTHHQVF